jgi:hypothetical protein
MSVTVIDTYAGLAEYRLLTNGWPYVTNRFSGVVGLITYGIENMYGSCMLSIQVNNDSSAKLLKGEDSRDWLPSSKEPAFLEYLNQL